MIGKHLVAVVLLIGVCVGVATVYVWRGGQITRTENTETENYVPGEVIVGFYDNVSEEEENSLFESYNLTYTPNYPRLFSYWVKVLSGSPEDFIDNLEASNIVLWAEVRGNPQGEPGADYILVQFNTRATQETAQGLINSFEGLEVSSIVANPKWDVVKVPVGQEQQWIETFEKENIVKYAQLNHIVHIVLP